jgi:hypothetical protein
MDDAQAVRAVPRTSSRIEILLRHARRSSGDESVSAQIS